MRKITLLLFVLMLAGCKSTVGPFQNFQRKPEPDPLLTDEEQQRQVRERYSYGEDNRNLTPNTYNNYPGVMGR